MIFTLFGSVHDLFYVPLHSTFCVYILSRVEWSVQFTTTYQTVGQADSLVVGGSPVVVGWMLGTGRG